MSEPGIVQNLTGIQPVRAELKPFKEIANLAIFHLRIPFLNYLSDFSLSDRDEILHTEFDPQALGVQRI